MDLGTIIALAALGVTVIGGAVAWIMRFGKLENAAEVAKQALTKADMLSDDLAEFKEKVAREYVTGAAIERVETRLVNAIDRLGDRLDRAFEARPAPRPRSPTKG